MSVARPEGSARRAALGAVGAAALAAVASVAGAAAGCGGGDGDERGGRSSEPRTVEPAAGHEPEGEHRVEPPPEFPREARSLELQRTIGVRLEPGDDAKRIGTIAIDTRVAWRRTAPGKGCRKSWIEIAPRGWICGDYVKPSTKPPLGREVPALDRGEIVPGVYGKVTAARAITYVVEKPKPKPKADRERRGAERGKPRAGRAGSGAAAGPITSPSQVDPALADGGAGAGAGAAGGSGAGGLKLVEGKPIVGSVNVRRFDEVVVGGRTYWRVDQKEPEYVLREAISVHRPSTYAGARLGDDTGWALPIAFVWSRWGGPAYPMYNARGAGGVYPTPIAARTPVQLLETFADAAGKPLAYRIGDARWLPAADVRVFTPVPPPALLEPGERWIDVDLDSQILVAYEGDQAVYATLVSTGTRETPTETGEYRMWLKQAEADMNDISGEDPYSVATVPWTQFFSPERGLALHTAYWHDGFGVRRSHGCINLAPRDARWLYFWSEPQVPAGWTMTAGVVEAPGSIVRVRTKDEPHPPPKGYAQKVVELRQQRAPVREGR